MVIKIRDNGVLKTYQVATSSDLFQKLDTPDTTGTSGQILGLNSNLETEWVDKPTVPTVISALTNDAGFITNTVSNLANYYTTANTYSKAEVNNLISQIPKMDIEVVSSLPTTDISTETIYLLSGGAESGNLYEEYLYVNNAWEKLGAQSITIPTPDWEASSGESGYVANRTHYKEEGLEEVLKTSFYNSGYYRGYHEVQANISPLVVGDEYTIEINGVQYTDTVYQSTGANFPALGNVNRFDNTPVRDFPFGIVQVYNSGDYIVLQCYATGNTALSGTIYKSGYSYTKLSNKYLDGKLIIQGTGGNFSEVFNSDTNIADGAYSHAEGQGTQAMGYCSHAAGSQTKANDWNSTAIGYGVIANRKSQFAFGEYNIPDVTGGSGARGQYIEVVGNGTYQTNSNARTLDWSGNMWCAGTVSAGTTASPAAVTNDNDLTTKAYVDGLVGDIETLLAGI